jgi:hypothetical protein
LVINWYPQNNNENVKIWTANKTLYAKVNSIDFVQLTSAKAQPSILSMLVHVFEIKECAAAFKKKSDLGIFKHAAIKKKIQGFPNTNKYIHAH